MVGEVCVNGLILWGFLVKLDLFIYDEVYGLWVGVIVVYFMYKGLVCLVGMLILG